MRVLPISVLLVVVMAGSGQQEPRRGVGTWEADAFGNHRVLLRVAKPAEAVWAHIEWRRRDADPDKKNLIVVEADSGARVANVARVDISREAGDVVFEARRAGDFLVYYLPYTGTVRSNYPKITYPPPEATADGAWLARHVMGAGPGGVPRWKTLPKATVVEIQSIDEFNSFYPMEVIATAAETRALRAKRPGASYLAFLEDRAFPIRMTDDLPERWVARGAGATFTGEAGRGEFYAFQVGVYALKTIEDLEVQFSGLTAGAGSSAIGADSFRCINLGGVDATARPFRKPLAIRTGKVQPIWCGFQVPEQAAPGKYTGTVTVAPAGLEKTAVRMVLTVTPGAVPDSGDDEPWRHSRIRWLDSTLAVDDDLVPPYTPVTVEGRRIGLLGRAVTIGDTGFPERIESRFTEAMTGVGEAARQILAAPVRLVVEDPTARPLPWTTTGGPAFTRQARGVAAWAATATAGPIAIRTAAALEFDGNLEYQVELKAAAQTTLGDVRLEIPIAKDVARYMMGLGQRGGLRPASLDWKWNARANQDSAWIGDVNAGLQFTLKDDKYSRPLNTNFYLLKPLVMPASWDNRGKGGCRIFERDAAVLVSCYSGPRTMAPGEVQRYDFRLLVTPFKPIDPKAQFSTRYLHAYQPIPDVVASGANTINIHHANDINPFINYPFLRAAEMKAYVDEAHRNGLKVKIYYTVRELSNRAPEIFALRSLGDEVFLDGPGGGPSWLQEHLGGNYIAGWYVPALKDAAVVTSGVSRWHNYYVEGLDWLVRNVGIDGLYIDDVAFDRTTMKRVRKVLDRGRPGALIDLHSANQFNPRDGFANSANLYLEHFPYLDRLWFGEYFDYNSQPDFWLTEVSGIPFGLMGEMLQDGGNPWRGMVYGMTGRLPRVDTTPLWKAWDEFGLPDARMVGYWVAHAPVTTGRLDVLATSYVRDGRTMVALASWASEPVNVALEIDWAALGLDAAKASIVAPAIEKFQEATTFTAGSPIPVDPGKGWLLVIR